jgi:hypothetical protein
MITKWFGRLPPKEQVGIGVALVFVVLLLADKFVVQAVAREISSKDADISILEDRIRHNRTVLRLKDSVTLKYEKVSDLIGESPPGQEANESLKGEVDEIATKAGVRLKSMQHLTPDPLDYLTTYYVDVSEYETETLNLLNFVEAVESVPGMLRIQRLVVEAQEPNTQVKGSVVISKVMAKGSGDAEVEASEEPSE